MKFAIKWDWHHTAILVVTTFGGAVLGYLQSQPSASLFGALTSWKTAQPLFYGALFSGIMALLALAKQTFLTDTSSSGGGRGSIQEMPGPMFKAPKAPPENTALRNSGTFMRRLAGACVGLAMFGVGCSWLQSPQGVATIKGGVDLAVCVLNHSTEPVPQIVTDCGASTAEDVVAILDAHHANDTKKLVSLAHAETSDQILKVLDAHSAANVRESSAKGGGQ